METDVQQSVRELERLLRKGKVPGSDSAEELAKLVQEASIPDIISVVERNTPVRAAVVFRLLDRARAVEVFTALDARHQADLIGALHSKKTLDFFDSLDPDDRVALLDELPAEVARHLMQHLSDTERDVTGIVLGYPKGSVGRAMSPEVRPLQQDLTIGEALSEIRQHEAEMETVYSLPVVDETEKLVGITSLRRLVGAQDSELLRGIMDDEPISAQVVADAEDTARRFIALGYIALPVVDDTNRVVGILTFDDAQELLESADSEDQARHGGHEPLQQPYLSTPLLKVVRSRIVWLLVLAVSAILTVQVLDAFEDKLEAAVVLSLFIPLLTGTGGNTGNQAATTITRALALGDVHRRDILQVMWRELRVGLTLGAVLGSLGFGLATFVYGLGVGTVIGTTLLAICAMSATVGAVMPIVAKTIGADPAVFSNPFISTFCDATGLIIYFIIATQVLGL